MSCQHGLRLSQAVVVTHSSGCAGSTFEDYAWHTINVSLRLVGDDWLASPNHPGLGFISGRLSVGLDPLSIPTFAFMKMKTAAHRRKIPRLLLRDSPELSAKASPPSSPSASSSPTLASPVA